MELDSDKQTEPLDDASDSPLHASEVTGALRALMAREPVGRYVQGLLATGLLDDLRTSGPHTLLAPVDEAFDRLPFAYDSLLFDDHLIEAKFDIFEYLVLRGAIRASGPRVAHASLQGERVRVGRSLVFGRFGAARVLRSFVSGGVALHVIDQCIFPIFPRLYMLGNAPWPISLVQ
jgi:uncharacterized surface protein with fasciclin (FAS1) repeats